MSTNIPIIDPNRCLLTTTQLRTKYVQEDVAHNCCAMELLSQLPQVTSTLALNVPDSKPDIILEAVHSAAVFSINDPGKERSSLYISRHVTLAPVAQGRPMFLNK